jgi:hypothetical protein
MAMVQCVGAIRNDPPTPPKTAGRGASMLVPLLPIANPDFIFFIKKAHNMRPTIKARDGEFTWT